MTTPRRAIVLAAGFATRLRPLSWIVPKPLLPVHGLPVLQRMFHLLRDWGVREVLVNLHFSADTIRSAVQAMDTRGVRVCFSFEPEILGTGGALKQAAWFLPDEPFWVANADVLARFPARPFVARLGEPSTIAALGLFSRAGPRTVEMDGHGAIRTFTSATPGAAATATFTGIQLVRPEIVGFFPEQPVFSIIDAYRAAMDAGHRIAAVSCDRGDWADIGTPAELLAANRARLPWRRGRTTPDRCDVRYHGDAILGPGVPDPVFASGIQVRATDLPRSHTIHHILPQLAAAYGWRTRDVILCPLSERPGSERSFARLRAGSRRAVLIEFGTGRPENARYAGHARFLRNRGISVPQVLGEVPPPAPGARGALAMEDVGDDSLERIAPAMPRARRLRRYRAVLDAVHALHALPPHGIALEPPFDATLYRWEHELFATHFLAKRLQLPPAQIRRIRVELDGIAQRLLREPRVLLHRDLQSSNIFLYRGRPYLIDFQGMRLGPAAYDLASLLCDPYVMLDEPAQCALLANYAACSPAARRAVAAFWPAAVQRLCQALGAYGRLAALPGMQHFAQHIPAALGMLARALMHVDGCGTLRQLVAQAALNPPRSTPV